jgi:Fe-S cluster biosynthesis and repair protein YggX
MTTMNNDHTKSLWREYRQYMMRDSDVSTMHYHDCTMFYDYADSAEMLINLLIDDSFVMRNNGMGKWADYGRYSIINTDTRCIRHENLTDEFMGRLRKHYQDAGMDFSDVSKTFSKLINAYHVLKKAWAEWDEEQRAAFEEHSNDRYGISLKNLS